MDFAIKSLLPRSQGNSSSTNVVDQDPVALTEEFARMLVAQIQNQDPENPMDPTEIISQNAQFTAALGTVRLANQMAHYEQVATTMRSMGKPAEYIDPNDPTQTPQVGIVTGADYSVTPPGLIINGTSIPLESITRIDDTASVMNDTTAGINKFNRLATLGKTVEYFDTSGNPQTGVVTDVDMLSTDPAFLTIDGVTSIREGDLIRVYN